MTQPSPEPPTNETSDALRRLAIVVGTLVAVAATTYVIPPLNRFRPWVPGDPWPLSSLFEPATESYAFGGTSGGGTEKDEDVEVAPRPTPTRRPRQPVVQTPTGPRYAIDASEYEGATVAIVDEGDRGLAPFYRQLLKTALEEDGAITRIAHYGDSSIATDHITYTLRRELQARFGDAGHGFVLVAKGYLPYRHRDVDHRASESWQLREITRNHDSTGWYGFGGIQFRGRPGATAHFGTSDQGPVGGVVSRFLVYYQKHPRGGAFDHRVDGGEWTRTEARAEPPEDAVLELDVPTGEHTLDLRFAGGQPRLYGVALESDGPGVVYDSLGLVGARASRLLNFDAEHVARQLRMRGTNLVVLGFGGNEAEDNIQGARYRTDYTQVLQRMHGGREDLGCLVFAPLDQGERDARGRVVTMENLPVIVEAQRAAAAEAGCAFFDTLEAMGGEGSIGRWLRQRLASGDLRHMTPSGYERVADAFYRALMQGFAGWLEREHASATGPASEEDGADEASHEDDAGVEPDVGTPIDAGTDAGLEEDAGVDAGAARPRRRRRARRRR
ncbi:MAG: hypothetical protein H6722_01535 [Sandaracinus sp.]|nr:hypothetical protein [Sandaracinus sp.]